jgi:hypothetical protein
VGDLGLMIPAIALGIGLVFGLTFDTTGPRIPRRMKPVPAAGAHPRTAVDGNGTTDADRRVRREGDEAPTAPRPEPAPPPVEPVKK